MDIQRGEKGTLQTLAVSQGYIFLASRPCREYESS